MKKISQITWPKRKFDPRNKKDVMEYKNFLKNSRWVNNCPFFLEEPFLSIPSMIEHTIIMEYINTIVKTAK